MMKPQVPIEPQQTLMQQRTRNAYANLHILHSKHSKLYDPLTNRSQKSLNESSILANKLLTMELGSLSHSKRKKTNQKLIFMQFLKDSRTIILGYDKASQRGDINFIDTSQPKINDFYYNKLQGGIGGLAVFKDGRYILVADKKGTFTYVDMYQGPNIDDIKNRSIQTPLEGVLNLSLSPSQTKAALGMSDRKCLIIDIETHKQQKQFPICKTFDKHAYGVNAIDWHPYKSLIISSSLDINDTLKLWDPHSQELIHDSNFHKNSIVTHCQFHPAGNSYFSLGKDNSILQYELRFKGILNKFYVQSQPTCMAVLNTGEIVVGDTMGHVTWFSQFAEVLRTQKGASAVVKIKVDDSSNMLVVAREREHIFEILTRHNLFDLNDY